MKRYLLLIIVGVLSAVSVMANDAIQPERIKMTAYAPRIVAVGDRFNVEYTFTYPDEVDTEQVSLSLKPTGELVAFIYGPGRSVSTSTTFNNSKKSVSTSIKWTYSFKALETGNFEIPDFVLVAYSDTIPQPRINRTVRFVKDSITEEAGRDDTALVDTTKVFLRLEIDRNKIQLGDSLTCNVVLLSNTTNVSRVNRLQHLEIEDCYLEQIYPDVESLTDTIDNVVYYKWVLCNFKIIPLRKGKFEIEPLKIYGELRVPYKSTDNGFWGAIPSYKYIPFETESEKLTFKVK